MSSNCGRFVENKTDIKEQAELSYFIHCNNNFGIMDEKTKHSIVSNHQYHQMGWIEAAGQAIYSIAHLRDSEPLLNGSSVFIVKDYPFKWEVNPELIFVEER